MRRAPPLKPVGAATNVQRVRAASGIATGLRSRLAAIRTRQSMAASWRILMRDDCARSIVRRLNAVHVRVEEATSREHVRAAVHPPAGEHAA